MDDDLQARRGATVANEPRSAHSLDTDLRESQIVRVSRTWQLEKNDEKPGRIDERNDSNAPHELDNSAKGERSSPRGTRRNGSPADVRLADVS